MTQQRMSTERRVGSAVLKAVGIVVAAVGLSLLAVVLRAYAVEWGVMAPPSERGPDSDFADWSPLLMACAIVAGGGALAFLGSLLSARKFRYWATFALGTGALLALLLLLGAIGAPAWSWGLSWLVLGLASVALDLSEGQA